MEKPKRTRQINKTSSNVPGFLSKTYKILENPEYNDIISWSEDGKSFTVKKPNEFSEQILPKYFKHNHFASFVRQLNMYDFHKSRGDTEENEWKHKQFKRGQPNLLSEIKRKVHDFQQNNDQQLSIINQNQEFGQFNQLLLKDMGQLRSKQDVLEKALSILIAQNNQILAENKILWQEMHRNKDKNNRKIEKLVSLCLSCMPNQLNDFSNLMKGNQLLNEEQQINEDQTWENETFGNSTTSNAISKYKNKNNDQILKKLFSKISNLKNKGQEKYPKNNLDHFVDNYHKNNEGLLQNLNAYVTNNTIEDTNNANVQGPYKKKKINTQDDISNMNSKNNLQITNNATNNFSFFQPQQLLALKNNEENPRPSVFEKKNLEKPIDSIFNISPQKDYQKDIFQSPYAFTIPNPPKENNQIEHQNNNNDEDSLFQSRKPSFIFTDNGDEQNDYGQFLHKENFCGQSPFHLPIDKNENYDKIFYLDENFSNN